MKNLATTYRLGSELFTLYYSDSDLSELTRDKSGGEGSRFVAAIGIFDNFTVAGGQNTEAWVQRSVVGVRSTAIDLRKVPGVDTTSWGSYLDCLLAKLERKDEDRLFIRHHYVWWYPKWLDMLRAGFQ